MKKVFTVLSLLLLATTLSFAADDDKLDKVSGCLMQIGEDYIVTDANGVQFEIDGMNDQLKANLGRVVEITGEFEGRSQDDDHKALKIDAKQLKVIAGECSADAVKQREGQASGIGAAASTSKPAASQTSSTTTTPSASGAVTQQTTTTTTTTTKAAEGSTVKSGTTTAQSGMPAAPSASVQGGVSTTPSTPAGAAAARPEADASIAPGNSGQETDTGKRSITGCVSRSGDHFVLTEQGTGTTYRLDGEGDKLDDHVGHMVTLTGEAEKLNETSSSGAQMEFDVEELHHVSDSCTASPKQ